MRRPILPLILIFLALLASGCQQSAPPPPPEEEEEEALRLDTFSLELPRDHSAHLPPEEIMAELQAYPDQLQKALANHGVEVGEVTVTMSSSPAATAQALSQGTVDAAYLPLEDYAATDPSVTPLLVSGGPFLDWGGAPEDWNSPQGKDALARAGKRILLVAGPSDYGRSLARKSGLTWEELSRANWGLVDTYYQGTNFWLSEHYEGNTLSALPHTARYGTEEVIQAAAAGEIDVFPFGADLWDFLKGYWDESAGGDSDSSSRQRPGSWDLTVIGVTEVSYPGVMAVRGGAAAGPRFGEALRLALEDMSAQNRLSSGGSGPYALAEGDLAYLRRLAQFPNGDGSF